MMKKKKSRNDVLLIFALILSAVIAFCLLSIFSRTGDYVVITLDREEIARYSLSEEIKETIRTKYGINHLIVEGGQAYISSADCPDKICVSHRKISKEGESIICLPHKLAISIESEDSSN